VAVAVWTCRRRKGCRTRCGPTRLGPEEDGAREGGMGCVHEARRGIGVRKCATLSSSSSFPPPPQFSFFMCIRWLISRSCASYFLGVRHHTHLPLARVSCTNFFPPLGFAQTHSPTHPFAHSPFDVHSFVHAGPSSPS